MKEAKKTIIYVRRGIGKTRYCACDRKGYPIKGFHKLSDVRKHWKNEIKRGHIELVRELNKTPNMDVINEAIRKMINIGKGRV